MGESTVETVPFTRILREDALTLPYKQRGNEFRPQLHWGQRKLLLSEIEFLTLHGEKSKTVLYVGAADGLHLVYLAGLFPDHHFYLYDPMEFHRELRQFAKNCKRIHMFQQYFNDEDIARVKSLNALFISDIRNLPVGFVRGGQVDEAVEEDIRGDMERQAAWIRELVPPASMVKFRLPWVQQSPSINKFTYLDGDIHLQAWAPVSSSEARLISTRVNGEYVMREYDTHWYDDAMHRFNRLTRQQRFAPLAYPTPLEAAVAAGLPLSYDVLAEQTILANYLRDKAPADRLPAAIARMCADIDAALGATLSERYHEKLAS